MLISVLRVIVEGFPFICGIALMLHGGLLSLRRVSGLCLGSMRHEGTSSSRCRPVCTPMQARFPKDPLPLPWALNIHWPHPSVWNSWADTSLKPPGWHISCTCNQWLRVLIWVVNLLTKKLVMFKLLIKYLKMKKKLAEKVGVHRCACICCDEYQCV